MATTPPEVVPGQVWADTRMHTKGRTIRIDSVDAKKAYCTLISMDEAATYRVAHGDPWYRDLTGMTLSVHLYRFSGDNANYELVSQPESMDRDTPTHEGTGV